jgi:hypothetical protein
LDARCGSPPYCRSPYCRVSGRPRNSWRRHRRSLAPRSPRQLPSPRHPSRPHIVTSCGQGEPEEVVAGWEVGGAAVTHLPAPSAAAWALSWRCFRGFRKASCPHDCCRIKTLSWRSPSGRCCEPHLKEGRDSMSMSKAQHRKKRIRRQASRKAARRAERALRRLRASFTL